MAVDDYHDNNEKTKKKQKNPHKDWKGDLINSRSKPYFCF